MQVVGGVAEVIERPAGIVVEVRDYDIKDGGSWPEGDHQGDKQDKDGDWYFCSIYEDVGKTHGIEADGSIESEIAEMMGF